MERFAKTVRNKINVLLSYWKEMSVFLLGLLKGPARENKGLLQGKAYRALLWTLAAALLFVRLFVSVCFSAAVSDLYLTHFHPVTKHSCKVTASFSSVHLCAFSQMGQVWEAPNPALGLINLINSGTVSHEGWLSLGSSFLEGSLIALYHQTCWGSPVWSKGNYWHYRVPGVAIP